MTITEVKVRRTYNVNRLRALVSITVDGDLAVHDIKVIEGHNRLFVAMPSKEDPTGIFRDVVHPITQEARTIIENAVINAYHNHLAQMDHNSEE